MVAKNDLINYQKRWAEVEAFQQAEARLASIALRWQQLNAAFSLAKGLGWLKPDPSEREVFTRWAKLKTQMLNRPKV